MDSLGNKQALESQSAKVRPDVFVSSTTDRVARNSALIKFQKSRGLDRTPKDTPLRRHFDLVLTASVASTIAKQRTSLS